MVLNLLNLADSVFLHPIPSFEKSLEHSSLYPAQHSASAGIALVSHSNQSCPELSRAEGYRKIVERSAHYYQH